MNRLLAALLALLTPLAAFADAGRTLGAHRFLPSLTVPDPFLASSIAITFTSGAAQGLTVPTYDKDNNELTTRDAGTISMMGGGFRAQIRIIDRLSLRLNYGMTARVGTTTATLLATGVSGIWNGTLGLSVKLFENDSFYLTATGDFRRTEILGIEPLDYIKDSDQPLVTQRFVYRPMGGVRGAWTIRDWVGVNAFVEMGPGFSEGTTDFSLAAGAQGSFSLEPATGAPCGFIATYRYERIPSDTPEASYSNSISGGVFLSGRNDFVIGLDVGYSWLAKRIDGNDYQLLQARAIMRYDFF